MSAPVQQLYVCNDDPQEVVEVVAADAQSTQVRHVEPQRHVGAEGWSMSMPTSYFAEQFSPAGTS